jgi:hypothetical protein
MSNLRLGVIAGNALVGLTVSLLGGSVLGSEDPKGSKTASTPDDALVLAAKIDQYLSAQWSAQKMQPAPLAEDAEFLRRVYLDIAGRIPSVSEARAFLDDNNADKRRRLVEKLLAGPGYVQNFTNIWQNLLVPENDPDFQFRFLLPSFEAWLRNQFADNTGYDQMVRELLTAPAGLNQGQFATYSQPDPGEARPTAFYAAKERKPENLAASTARIFLGIKLECAQCHNHPFAKWTRDQFWEYAAFFAGFEKQDGGRNIFAPVEERLDRRELAIPGVDRVVQAAFLDGSEPKWKYKVSSRITLADWVTSPDNPYFARAAVNRLWAHFFGLGIVEPVDDLGGQNQPSHPELLDELSRQFAAHRFDFKFLIRAITNSRAYQLSSATSGAVRGSPDPTLSAGAVRGSPDPALRPTAGLPTANGDLRSSEAAGSGDPRRAHEGADEPRLFARMAVKGMTPEQLYDSLAQATGFPLENRELNPFAVDENTPRAEFRRKFADQEKRTEFQTSILQALALMNGGFVADATNLTRSQTLAAIADAPFLDMGQRIETLFLATLSRKPRPAEATRFLQYINQSKNPKTALADVFWALLNSSEFLLNH